MLGWELDFLQTKWVLIFCTDQRWDFSWNMFAVDVKVLNVNDCFTRNTLLSHKFTTGLFVCFLLYVTYLLLGYCISDHFTHINSQYISFERRNCVCYHYCPFRVKTLHILTRPTKQEPSRTFLKFWYFHKIIWVHCGNCIMMVKWLCYDLWKKIYLSRYQCNINVAQQLWLQDLMVNYVKYALLHFWQVSCSRFIQCNCFY